MLLTADILGLMNMGFKSTCQLFKNKDIIERLNIKKSDIEEKKIFNAIKLILLIY